MYVVIGVDELGNEHPVIVLDMRESLDPQLGDDVYTRKIRITATVPCDADIVRLVFPDGRTFAVTSRQMIVMPSICRAILEGQFEG